MLELVLQGIKRALIDEEGFSCLEILTCSMVIVLAVAVAVPRYAMTDELRLQYEAVHLINDLRYIQQKDAVFAHDNASLLDKNDGIYSLEVSSGDGSYTIVKNMQKPKKGKLVIRQYELPKDISIYANTKITSYTFSRNWATAGTISLKKNKYVLAVVIDGPGRIRLVKNY